MSQAITSRFKSDEFAAFVELDQDADYRSLDHYRGEGYGRLLMDVKTGRILGAEYRDPETDEVVDGQPVDCRVVPPLSEQLRRADGDAVWLRGNFSCWTFCVYRDPGPAVPGPASPSAQRRTDVSKPPVWRSALPGPASPSAKPRPAMPQRREKPFICTAGPSAQPAMPSPGPARYRKTILDGLLNVLTIILAISAFFPRSFSPYQCSLIVCAIGFAIFGAISAIWEGDPNRFWVALAGALWFLWMAVPR